MNVLIVDDSAFMRKVITDLVRKIPSIEKVETAVNGKEAIEKVMAGRDIDLVLMDLEMPVTDGLTALKQIKRNRQSIAVIMLSALNNRQVTIEALDAGAADFIEKPVNLLRIDPDWVTDFHNKILMVNYKKTQLQELDQTKPTKDFYQAVFKPMPPKINALVIGASTGGPKTLLEIIRNLPPVLKVPIFIVQHMPKGFTASFAQRLDSETNCKVVEAKNGMPIQRQVYLCPGDYHMTLETGKIRLNQLPKLHGTRPAVDYLFISAAEVYRANLVAVLLTGMGKDGAKGMAEIERLGGYNIAEAKASCVVFGMPRSAIELGVVNEILDLAAIKKKINQIVR
jgi:two-component system chemotaxis response regulator CheB